jgi:hypothetical protein
VERCCRNIYEIVWENLSSHLGFIKFLNSYNSSGFGISLM